VQPDYQQPLFQGHPLTVLKRFCITGKLVKCKQVSVGDGTGRYTPLILVFANSQLSRKDFPVSMVKKKNSFETAASLQESQRALLVSSAEPIRCT